MGDRLLAINGQALLGLSRDDVVLLLKHAHDQVSLQIEYDVCHKGMIRHTVELGSYGSLSERGEICLSMHQYRYACSTRKEIDKSKHIVNQKIRTASTRVPPVSCQKFSYAGGACRKKTILLCLRYENHQAFYRLL